MKMYRVCLRSSIEIVCEEICKTKEDAELELINLVHGYYSDIIFCDYANESHIDEIEVYTDHVTRRFPDIMLFSIFTDDEECKYFEDFYDDIETLINKKSDKKIEENTNMIKIEIWYNKGKIHKFKLGNRDIFLSDNNEVYIIFGVDTTNCKTLEDIFDKARNQLSIILHTYDISKFVLMNKEEIIESKFIPTDEYEDFYVKYCNI